MATSLGIKGSTGVPVLATAPQVASLRASLGLDAVDNTADANKPANAAFTNALAVAVAAKIGGGPPPSGASFRVTAGKIYDGAGTHIQIRGISHFGFNADILQPQYLWQMDWKAQLAQIASLGFNAIRCPFVPQTLYSAATVDSLSWLVNGPGNNLWHGLTPLQALDSWMAECDRLGLYVLLDYHSVSNVRQYPFWFVFNPADFALTYNGLAYPKESWIRDLVFVADRYKANPHFMGIDVYNEPNGTVRWDAGDPAMTQSQYYWKPAVELAAAAILAANPNLLIFVQGITPNFDGIENSTMPINWGENFQPEASKPLLIAADKLVLCPHTYGPDVSMKTSFAAPNFPANLAADWETLFGRFYPAHPVIIGEWGGKFGAGTGGAMDAVWQNALVDYLLSKGISDSYYWCYTPNSGDTGGILDNALAVIPGKMALLHRLWGV